MQADVDLDRCRAAQPVDLALLDRAQQLGLQARVHFADLVEQKRAPVGLLELADAAYHGPGERTFLVAEQLRFEEIVRNRGAIYRYQALLAPAAVLMQIARQHLLAGATLAGDQHTGIGGRDLARNRQKLPHRHVLEHQLARVRRQAPWRLPRPARARRAAAGSPWSGIVDHCCATIG